MIAWVQGCVASCLRPSRNDKARHVEKMMGLLVKLLFLLGAARKTSEVFASLAVAIHATKTLAAFSARSFSERWHRKNTNQHDYQKPLEHVALRERIVTSPLKMAAY